MAKLCEKPSLDQTTSKDGVGVTQPSVSRLFYTGEVTSCNDNWWEATCMSSEPPPECNTTSIRRNSAQFLIGTSLHANQI